MRITLVSSCGLVLEQDGSALLIDALNKQFRCYYGLPPEVFAKMLAGEPPYDAVCGVLFTPTITAPAARSSSARPAARRFSFRSRTRRSA